MEGKTCWEEEVQNSDKYKGKLELSKKACWDCEVRKASKNQGKVKLRQKACLDKKIQNSKDWQTLRRLSMPSNSKTLRTLCKHKVSCPFLAKSASRELEAAFLQHIN